MALQFGVFVPQGWRMDLVEIPDPVEKYEAMTAVAKAADELPAYDSIWVYDHFHTVPEPVRETVFEAWTITAALTRDTRRVNVGQMVTCNGYRNPALLAKMGSTVDVMSHGRLYFGLGAGWYEHEWKAYGYGFPETRERIRAFREACAIITSMWTEDEPVFSGEYYTINKPINEPKGARKPHPSFWIGGGGEQVTLRLVAKYADACNVGGGNPDTARHKLDVLRGHCEKLGRDYDAIIRSTSLFTLLRNPGEDRDTAIERIARSTHLSKEYIGNQFFVCTVDELKQRVQTLADAGITYVIFNMPGLAYNHEPMRRVAEEVIPAFA